MRVIRKQTARCWGRVSFSGLAIRFNASRQEAPLEERVAILPATDEVVDEVHRLLEQYFGFSA